ncbi:cytochrome P450, partial [Trifolium medium]|nr:cytochrome P450 [Trifolium medium]
GLNDEDAAQVATMLWSIWKQRNNKVWNNTVDAQSHVITRAEELIRDWAAVRTVQNRATEVQPGVVMNRWNKPLPGRFKCNIDAAFTGDKVGIG